MEELGAFERALLAIVSLARRLGALLRGQVVEFVGGPARARVIALFGAVLALNPNTGEILALYSAPGYDPNAFVGGVDPDYWRSLNLNPAHPLLDRAIKTFYPPGSTWKLAVATMGLRRGIVTLRSHMPKGSRKRTHEGSIR